MRTEKAAGFVAEQLLLQVRQHQPYIVRAKKQLSVIRHYPLATRKLKKKRGTFGTVRAPGTNAYWSIGSVPARGPMGPRSQSGVR